MRNTRSQQSQPSPTNATISSTSASRSGQVRNTVPPATQSKKRPTRSQARSRYEEDFQSDDNLSDQFNPNNDLSESEEEDFEIHNCPQEPATKRPRTQLADSSNYTTTNTTTQTSTNSLLDDKWTLPTVSNYKSLANAWPTSRISEARRRSVPPSGQPAKLAERNKIIGNKWTSLPDMEQLVYDPTIFFTLSGLPLPKKVKPVKLSSADCDELQILYDESVSSNKVSKVYANVAAGIPDVKVIGDCPKKGFPCKPDPAQYLRDKGYPVEAVQLPGSTLRHEDLLLGFDKMNSKRTQWLNDLKAGLFKFKKITEDPIQVNNPSGSNNSGVSNPADTQGEDEEWGGISDSCGIVEDIDPDLDDLDEDSDDLPDENNF
ncbi:uncharacterized protein MELLADRAFT_103636 [Melampsora larici-populina 98AG31]|uniref:Uncharacterized protein n=1 Tax=Melampsora larici-populina (strain 98AG31 / pathotype 3-4-7) TaxID=747676 RepID=F4RBZ3_MELLP|nr:uncharacterized protein MELLADRAFT_103636 [Melampsora larici-populina 98AG31]EGG10253.1 hypothetical protein MELLADRAFT_103636 [Melampsora larici-populina 98AG31]